jgi:hypothetical protein
VKPISSIIFLSIVCAQMCSAQTLFSSDKRERGGRAVGADYFLLSTLPMMSKEGFVVGRIRTIDSDDRGRKKISDGAFAAVCQGNAVGILFEGTTEISPVDPTTTLSSMAERQTYDLWWLVCRGKKNAY